MRIIGRNTVALATVLLLAATMAEGARGHGVYSQIPVGYTFGPTVNNLALAAKPVQESVGAGGPIEINFAITNFGAPIRIFRLGSAQEYALAGIGPGGTPIKKYDRQSIFSGSVSSGMTLPTAGVYVNTVDDLGRFYDFRSPGRYTFSVQTSIRLEFHLDQNYALLKSNTVTLDVR